MIEQILNPKMLNALGWSLIHSLWQVAAVAVLLALVLLVLRKSTARLRYNIAISSLLVCFCLFIGTFSFYYFNENIAETQTVYIDNNDTEITAVFITNEVTETNYKNENQSNFTLVFYDYFNTHLPVVVTLWFLGLTLFVIRFLGGLAYVQRLKNSNHQPLNEEWEMVLDEVKTKLKIDKVVQLVESSLVNVPMVVGYLKPMILMPIGAINYLTVEEVEAIFAHELAHIKRYDYFVNLLQSIIETILFYHPAIWWISSEIRRERENCCDDLALEVTGNSLTLAKALAKLEQFRMNFVNRKIQLSMTALKNKNQLLQRIQRILNEPQSNNATLKGLFAAIILVVCFFATSLDAQEKSAIPAPVQATKMEMPVAPKANFPERKKELRQSEKVFPEVPKVTPNSIVPVSPTISAFPTKSVAPVIPISPVKPVKGLQQTQPVQPVPPVQPKGFTTFSFTEDEPEMVYVQLHNDKFVRRINTNSIDKISVLRDTSIEGETKEIIIIKEVKEGNQAAKEVKISIKNINGMDEITVYENGRKLSKAEAEKYESEVRSDRMELDAITVEMKEREREMRALEREMQAEARKMKAEERLMLAEQRKVMAEERKIMAKERLQMQAEMEESRAEMLREVETMKTERTVEMKRLEKEQKSIHLERERFRKERLKEGEERRNLSGEARLNRENRNTKKPTTSSTTTTTSTTTGCATTTGDKWFDEFIAILKKDGLLDKETNDIRLKLSETSMRLNGKKLSTAQAKKYYQLYEKLSGTAINGEVEIRKK